MRGDQIGYNPIYVSRSTGLRVAFPVNKGAARMVGALANVEGHRSKYEMLKRSLPPEEVGKMFVGGGDPVQIGFIELEMIRRFKKLEGISVVDIGCGIGRLTRHLIHEPIESYLGVDIIPEILAEAEEQGRGDPRFRFSIGVDCTIPTDDASVDIVVAYSVLTHLLDAEIYDYFRECKRVLRSGGVAVLTFVDFMYPPHTERFFQYAALHRQSHGDLLQFVHKDVLALFAARAGFDGIEFIDGLEDLKTSGLPTKLMTPETTPATIKMHQSICVLRA